MNPPSPPAKEPPTSKRPRWLRRGLSALFICLLLGIIAHRPLLQLAANRAVPYYAAKKGYKLEWHVSGSMLSHVSIDNMHLVGPPGARLKQLECRKASIDYSLWSLFKEGWPKGLHGITLVDASIDLDMRRITPSPVKPTMQLPDFELQKLDLHNIQARIQAEDGDTVLQGFTLLLDEKRTGTLEIKELTRATTGLHLKDVHGTAQLKARSVVITDLALMPEVTVPRLAVNLQRLHEGSLPFEVTAHSGNASIHSSGRIDHLTRNPSLDLTLNLKHLSHSDLSRWVKLPENTSWLVESAEVQIKGSLAEPRKLQATMSLTVSDLHAADMHFDDLHSRASLINGALKVESLSLRSGSNTFQAQADAVLPPTWNDMKQLSADVLWQLRAPELESMIEPGSSFSGALHGSGSASIHHGRLGAVQASLRGTQLMFKERSIASLNMEISTADGMVRVTSLDLNLDDQNSAALKGQINLAERQRADFTWNTDIGNLASIIRFAGMKETPPNAREVTAHGTLNFNVVDLMEGGLKAITCEGIAELADLTWRQRQIGRTSLQFLIHDGRMDFSKFDLHLDAESNIRFKGDVSLTGNRSVNLQWKSDVANLGSLSQWMELNDAPEAGKFTTEGSAKFSLTDLLARNYRAATVNGTATLESVKWQQRHLEAASLTFALNEGRLELKNLDVRLDSANKARLTGDVLLADDRQPANFAWDLELTNLAGVAPWLGVKNMPLPGAGVVTSSGKASGSWADLQAKNFKTLEAAGVVHMKEVAWQKGRLDFATLEFSSHLERLDLKKIELQLNDRNKFAATGHWLLDDSHEFEGEVVGTFDKLADFSGWMELARLPRITRGQASINWKGRGKLFPHQISGTGSVHVTDLKLEDRAEIFALALESHHADQEAKITKFQASYGKLQAEASMTITDNTLSIPRLVLFSDKTRFIEGSAEVPLSFSKNLHPMLIDANRPLKVDLHMQKVNMQTLFTAMGRKTPVTGFVAMDVSLHGTLQEFNGTLTAKLSEAKTEAAKNKLEPAQVQVDITMAERQLMIKASARQKPLQTVTADAKLPFDVQKIMASPGSLLNEPLTARIHLPQSDLSILQRMVPSLASIDGTVSAEVQLSGPLRKPEWQGAILAGASRMAINDSDMDIRNLKGRATFKGQLITLDDVSATISGGQVKIGGTVDLTQLADPALNLQMDANQALIVRNDTMSLRADGRLTCVGTVAKSEVAGKMELVRGRIFKEIEFLPLSLPDQLPRPPPVVRVKSATPSAPAPFRLWGLNIDIVTRDPIRLLGNVLNGSAVAKLHLSGTGAAPVLEGTISQQGARIRLPFSHLALSRGDIIFTRDKPFDPQLDLQGDSIVGNYHVSVYATGSAANPTLRFTSSPPLSEPDIATLLATGTTKGDAQTTQGVAANRVAFLILSKAYRRLFNKAAPIRKNEEPGRFTLNLNPLSSQSSLGNLSATYEISPHWQAEVGLGDHGFRGLVHYLIRFR